MLRRLVSFVGHRVREVMLWPKIFASGHPRVVFLPTDIRTASSALRGYDLADELRKRGWSTLVLPKQLELSQRKRILRQYKPDIAVLLKSRLKANSHELLLGIPYIYDIDDADFHDAKIVDRIKADVTHADAVIAGSQYVADWCKRINANTTVSWSGSPATEAEWPPHSARGDVITWAQSAPLGYDAERAFVIDVFKHVVAKRTPVTLRLYGCKPKDNDHPDIQLLREMGVKLELKPTMPYADFIASLRDVSVGLSAIVPENEFSRGKSFGKILAYISSGVPVIASDEGDHSRILQNDSAVLSNNPEVWADAILELLDNPKRRDRMAAAAHEIFLAKLSTDAAADRLEVVVNDVLKATGKK